MDRIAALLLGGRDLVVLHRRVGGAEVDGARAELRDAAAGADGLVVDGRALVLLEAGGPLLVDGRRERRAGAVDACRRPWRSRRRSSSTLEPPELGLLSLLPQAAAPSASTAQQLRASRFLYLTGDSSSSCSVGRRADARGRGDSLLPLVAPGCEKRVKARARIGSRSRRACGCSARPAAPARASPAACGCRRRSTGRPRAALLPRRAGRGPRAGTIPPPLRASATSSPNSRTERLSALPVGQREPLARMDLERADGDRVLVLLCRRHSGPASPPAARPPVTGA